MFRWYWPLEPTIDQYALLDLDKTVLLEKEKILQSFSNFFTQDKVIHGPLWIMKFIDGVLTAAYDNNANFKEKIPLILSVFNFLIVPDDFTLSNITMTDEIIYLFWIWDMVSETINLLKNKPTEKEIHDKYGDAMVRIRSSHYVLTPSERFNYHMGSWKIGSNINTDFIHLNIVSQDIINSYNYDILRYNKKPQAYDYSQLIPNQDEVQRNLQYSNPLQPSNQPPYQPIFQPSYRNPQKPRIQPTNQYIPATQSTFPSENFKEKLQIWNRKRSNPSYDQYSYETYDNEYIKKNKRPKFNEKKEPKKEQKIINC